MNVEELNEAYLAAIVPKTSSKIYEKDFEKFIEFIKKKDVYKIDEKDIRAYIIYNIEILKRSESSVINYTSKIKTVLLSKGKEFNNLFWRSVYKFISSSYKNIVKNQAPEFESSDFSKWFLNFKPADAVGIQKKIACCVAFAGALRCQESHALKWEDLRIDNEREEVLVQIKKSKNGKCRGFMIAIKKFYSLLMDYKSMIQASNLWLYPGKSNKSNIFNKAGRRGIKWFQKLPKEMASFMGIKNASEFTHHSFRRSSACAAFENGCTLAQIKLLGGWSHESTAAVYINSSLGSKRKIAQNLFAGVEETQVDEPEASLNKKVITTKSSQSDFSQNSRKKVKILEKTKLDSVFEVQSGISKLSLEPYSFGKVDLEALERHPSFTEKLQNSQKKQQKFNGTFNNCVFNFN